MLKLAMNNDNQGEPNYFDILIDTQSYRRFFYALFVIPLSLIKLALLLLIFGMGILLSPIILGIYFLNFSFFILHELTKFEEFMIEWFLGIVLPKVIKQKPMYSNIFKHLWFYMTDSRNWKRLAYFLVKPVVIIPYSICAFAFIALASTMIYMPIKSVFGHIDFFGIYTTDSFIEVIFIYFMSFIALVGLLKLNSAFMKSFGTISRRFLSR